MPTVRNILKITLFQAILNAPETKINGAAPC